MLGCSLKFSCASTLLVLFMPLAHKIRFFRSIAFLLSLTALGSAAATAKDRTWYRYENAYFEAFSDASEKRVLRILNELENFRAASAQFVNLQIPNNAMKTRLFIFRSRGDFQDVIDDKLVDAFVIGVENVPTMVMPTSLSASAKVLIRHEYTHVLLAYAPSRYPVWYQEGFAEFMSGTELRNKGTAFTIGEPIGRQAVGGYGSLVPWDELIADDFDMHAIKGGMRRSNAYLQSWLLVHYLSIGDRLSYREPLAQYLGRHAEGMSSKEAFAASIDVPIETLGNRLMDSYSKRIPYYTIEFTNGLQDLDFSRAEADSQATQVLIEKIASRVRQGRN